MPSALARCWINSTMAELSMGGSVLGIQQMLVKPPRAAALVPAAMVSLYS